MTKKIFLITSFLFLFLILKKIVLANYTSDACYPAVCTGSGNYDRILTCEFNSTGYPPYYGTCVNGDTQYSSYICQNKSCNSALLSGTGNCNPTPIEVKSSCTCSNGLDSCDNSARPGTLCGDAPYIGVCENCTYVGTCSYPPATQSLSCCAATPYCGDGTCNGNETCTTCGTDCGICPSYCGDKVCDNDENCGNCSDDCGGPSCGGECNTANTPHQVNGVKVNNLVNGNVDLSSSNTLHVTWNDPGIDPYSSINYYQLYIWDKDQGSTPPSSCNSNTHCTAYTTSGKVESYIATASSVHDSNIYVAVRAVNNTCSPSRYGAWSSSSSYNLVGDVTGSFYNDPNASADTFNNCSGSSSNSIDLSSYQGSLVSSSNGGSTNSLTTNYTLNDLVYAPNSGWEAYGSNLTLSIDNSNSPNSALYCSCPSGSDETTCTHTDTAVPSTENFFLTALDLSHGPWWQVVSGNIYGKSSFRSDIPDTCEDDNNCLAYAIRKDSSGSNDSAGIPLTGSSSIRTNGYYSQRDSKSPKAVNTTHNNLKKETYAHFLSGIDLSLTSSFSDTTDNIPHGATHQEDAEVYFHIGDVTFDLTTTQNIVSDRKVIILVNGNITFSSNPDTTLVTVEQGGFIAFIASGDIIFDENVGNSSANDEIANISGVFVADGVIRIAGYSDERLRDNKFVGEGSFVGWSSFSFNRDYSNTTTPAEKALNNTNPMELFIFRPDFNVNTPVLMKRPSTLWQEVN